MGALWASAIEYGGEWCPNYYATSKQIGIDERVLRRWWAERDLTQDAENRTQAHRARLDANYGGARAWHEWSINKLRDHARELLDGTRLAEADADEAARAIRNLADYLRAEGTAIGLDEADGDDGSGHPDAIEARVRSALERTGAAGPAPGPGGPVPDGS